MAREDLLSSSKNVSFRKKNTSDLPKGAKVISKETRMEVEEIENGFIVNTSTDYKYTLPDLDDSQYLYVSKKVYSKENPISIKLDSKESKTYLADLL